MLKNNFEINISDEAEVHNQATAIQIKVLQRARERKFITSDDLAQWVSDGQSAEEIRKWLETNLIQSNYTSEEELIDACLELFFHSPHKYHHKKNDKAKLGQH